MDSIVKCYTSPSIFYCTSFENQISHAVEINFVNCKQF